MLEEDVLLQYGMPRRSGRYPWGSGKNPQRSRDFLIFVDDARSKGMTDKDMQEAWGMTSTEFRQRITWANEDRKRVLYDSVLSRVERGDKTNVEIAKELGISEAYVRNIKNRKDEIREKQANSTKEILKEFVDKHGYLDVGPGVEIQLGISRTKLEAVVKQLEIEEGYYNHNIYTKRLQDPSRSLTVNVLTKEADYDKVVKNSEKIRAPEAWSEDGGLTFQRVREFKSVDWGRVSIKYAEDGGEDMDGVIELRRGVSDLDMGGKKYAQVRIKVGDDHYLKGMAMYADDLPDGVDIRFNTNKGKGTPKEKVLKATDDNASNPFGSTINRQRGALNIVNEEGMWNTWSSKLSAQFLSKQSTKLVKERVDATYDELEAEYELLKSLTNPVVKKHLMESYADGLDSKAKHLKAKGISGTKSHVILPFTDMNPNEVYAPNYKNGDRVVLIRYPHGGIFELPELTVNNNGPAKKTLANASDAIGIHPSVAKKLSGADFDGDTVYVVPNNTRKIKTAPSLPELKDFDPMMYKVDRETISKSKKDHQMGVVSNLITDMTIKGAPMPDIARAVKHSMVVIDAHKHKLDYKQSEKDNKIRALQKEYQTHANPITGKKTVGASTIVSLSKRTVEIEAVNPKTGKPIKKKVDLIDHVDLNKLSSGTPTEKVYTDYITKVKTLKNTAQKEVLSIKPPKADPKATKKYAEEVESLNKKLDTALLNAPKERQAQLIAKHNYYKNMSDDMDSDGLKKLKSQSVADARELVGAKRKQSLIEISDKEWEAIQNRAISPSKLITILDNSDMDRVKKLSMPRTPSLTPAKVARAQSMLDKGYSYSQVADALGTSVSSLHAELSEPYNTHDTDD